MKKENELAVLVSYNETLLELKKEKKTRTIGTSHGGSFCRRSRVQGIMVMWQETEAEFGLVSTLFYYLYKSLVAHQSFLIWRDFMLDYDFRYLYLVYQFSKIQLLHPNINYQVNVTTMENLTIQAEEGTS